MSSKARDLQVRELWRRHGLKLFGLKPLGQTEPEEEEPQDDTEPEDDNLDLQGQDTTPGQTELSQEQIQEVMSMNESLQQQVTNLQNLVLNLSQERQQTQPQAPQAPEKPKKDFQMPSLDMETLSGLTEDEQALARVMAKILPTYLKASIEPVMEQVSGLEAKHGQLESNNEQARINSEVNRVFTTFPDAFNLQNKMVALANDRRYAHIAKDPEALYWVAKGQASAAPARSRQQQQPKRLGGGKPSSQQPSSVKPARAKTPGDAIRQAFEQNPDIRKRLRDSEY